MRLTTDKLRAIIAEAVRGAVAEAKRKKAAGKKPKKEKAVDGITDVPPGYKHSETLDFSKPLGRRNVIKNAGAANFGPYTGESILRKMVADVIRETLSPKPKNR